MTKAWDPNWKELPPVELLDREVPLPVVEIDEKEKARRRRDYRFNHERHVRGKG